MNFLATTELMLTARGTRRRPSRLADRKKSIGRRGQGPRSRLADVQGFTLAFDAPAPPPAAAAVTAWAAAINKSISTRWITFILLGDCYPEERESRLMGKLILQ